MNREVALAVPECPQVYMGNCAGEDCPCHPGVYAIIPKARVRTRYCTDLVCTKCHAPHALEVERWGESFVVPGGIPHTCRHCYGVLLFKGEA